MSSSSQMAQMLTYQMRDVLRSRWILFYGLFFAALTEALFFFGTGSGSQVLVSLINVVLLLTPLVSILFGTLYLYGAREFNILLLAQPVGRSGLFGSLYAGIVAPLSVAFILGVGFPLLFRAATVSWSGAFVLMVTGVLLTGAFTAIAFAVATRFDERVQGMGIAVGIWLVAALLYDGFVLMIAALFAHYPLERTMIALTVLNPIDLGRVLLLLQFDVAALLGYTGAVFERFFGSGLGRTISVLALLAWAGAPLALAHRMFCRKDF